MIVAIIVELIVAMIVSMIVAMIVGMIVAMILDCSLNNSGPHIPLWNFSGLISTFVP